MVFFCMHYNVRTHMRVQLTQMCKDNLDPFFFFCLNAGIRHLPLFLSIMGGGDLSHGRVLAFDWSGQAEK